AFWLVTATLFRAIFGTSRRHFPGEASECPRCGRPMPPDRKYCITCGLERHGPIADELADLRATLRQLERFQEHGEFTADERDRLIELVEDRQRRLTGRTPHGAEPARPVAEPPPFVIPPAFTSQAVEIQPAESEVQPGPP